MSKLQILSVRLFYVTIISEKKTYISKNLRRRHTCVMAFCVRACMCVCPNIVNLNKVLSLHFTNEAGHCENPPESYKLRIPLMKLPKSSLNCKAKFAILHVVKHIEKDRRMRTTD